MKLGEERAMAVRDYIARPARASPSTGMEVISYGETKPVADNKTKERPRPEPPRRHQRPRVGRPGRGGPAGLPAPAGIGPPLGRIVERRWTCHPDWTQAASWRPGSGRPGGAGCRRGRPPGPGPRGEPLCLRGDREALPAAGLRRGPPHRAAPRRGRRRGPGGLPARAPGPRAASTSRGRSGPGSAGSPPTWP